MENKTEELEQLEEISRGLEKYFGKPATPEAIQAYRDAYQEMENLYPDFAEDLANEIYTGRELKVEMVDIIPANELDKLADNTWYYLTDVDTRPRTLSAKKFPELLEKLSDKIEEYIDEVKND